MASPEQILGLQQLISEGKNTHVELLKEKNKKRKAKEIK